MPELFEYYFLHSANITGLLYCSFIWLDPDTFSQCFIRQKFPSFSTACFHQLSKLTVARAWDQDSQFQHGTSKKFSLHVSKDPVMSTGMHRRLSPQMLLFLWSNFYILYTPLSSCPAAWDSPLVAEAGFSLEGRSFPEQKELTEKWICLQLNGASKRFPKGLTEGQWISSLELPLLWTLCSHNRKREKRKGKREIMNKSITGWLGRHESKHKEYQVCTLVLADVPADLSKTKEKQSTMFCSTTPEKQRAEQLKCSGKQEERSWARQGFSDLVQNVSGRGNQNRKAGYANPTGHGKSLDVPADAAFLVITLLGKHSPTILSDYNARI